MVPGRRARHHIGGDKRRFYYILYNNILLYYFTTMAVFFFFLFIFFPVPHSLVYVVIVYCTGLMSPKPQRGEPRICTYFESVSTADVHPLQCTRTHVEVFRTVLLKNNDIFDLNHPVPRKKN